MGMMNKAFLKGMSVRTFGYIASDIEFWESTYIAMIGSKFGHISGFLTDTARICMTA